MTTTLLVALVFAAVTTAVLGVWSLVWDVWYRDQETTLQRIDREFGLDAQQRETDRPRLFKDLGQLALGLSFGVSWRRQFNTLLDQAGVPLTPRQFLHTSVGLGALLGGVLALWNENALVGLVGALAGMLIPLLILYSRRRSRQQKLLRQLPEVLDLIARTLSSGHTLVQSFQEVAREFPSPIGIEFAFCAEQNRLGLPLETALEDLSNRTGLLEMRVLVMALMVQQQSGGNLAALLQQLSRVVRERFRILGKIRTLTAEGRMQAWILMALAPAIFTALFFLRRDYVLLLLRKPMLIVGVVAAQVIGCLWIRRITAYDSNE